MTADQSRKQALRCLQAAEQTNAPKLKVVLLAEAAAYGLIAAGISIAIITVVGTVGTKLNTTFTSISTALK